MAWQMADGGGVKKKQKHPYDYDIILL